MPGRLPTGDAGILIDMRIGSLRAGGRRAILVMGLLLAGCAGPGRFISAPPGAPPGRLLAGPDKHILLIFNHGSLAEANRDICWPTTFTVPEVVRDLDGKTIDGLDIVIYNFCSTSPGSYDAADRVGEPKIDKRVERIEALVRSIEKAGVPPDRIFLVGHSAGGWASLMVARRQRVKFNAVIAFGPAFAGKKASRPQGWEALRQEQAGALAEADRIDGLVYAYADDPYEPVSDMTFLGEIPGIRLVRVGDRPGMESGGCAGPFGHRTAFRDCFARSQERVILDYVASRLRKRLR